MDWMTLILSVLLGVLGIFYVFRQKMNKLDEWGLLYLKPLPFLGNMAPALFRKCHLTELLTKLYYLDEDAEYVGLYQFTEPIIVLRSPEIIKNITVRNFDHFVDHRNFVDPEQDPLFGSNLFGLQGERWKEMRNVLSPAFTSSKMKEMFKLMLNCGTNFVDYLTECLANGPIVLDSKDVFTKYTNDVIATCAFGISVDSMRYPKNDFYVLGKDLTNFDGFRTVKFFLMRCFPKIAKIFNMKFMSPRTESFFLNVVKDTIETREREGIKRPDMIQLMMETRSKKSGEAPVLTMQDITAQALVFFFGGFESSARAMCFAAHEISVNAEIQQKLRDEVDKVLRQTNGELTYEAINGMQYLDAVINESMRMFPVVMALDRVCVKTFELPPALPGAKSIIVEPGQNLWIPSYPIQRDAKYFPNPEKFDPERFMGDAKNNIDPFAYLPFGQGPRMCIGNRFAMLEIKVLLFHLLSKCHLKLCEKMKLPLELSKGSIQMEPKGGFWLELESRDTSVAIRNENFGS